MGAAIDLHRAINEAVDMMQPEAGAKSVALEVSLEPGSEELAADPDRLKQVAWNLLANAIEFTPRGGRVTVRARREGPDVYIEVLAPGSGTPPISCRTCSIASARATPAGRGGLGLRLAIVRDLVELHGGIVRASFDGKGKGATFTVRLSSGAFVEAPGAARAAGYHTRAVGVSSGDGAEVRIPSSQHLRSRASAARAR